MSAARYKCARAAACQRASKTCCGPDNRISRLRAITPLMGRTISSFATPRTASSSCRAYAWRPASRHDNSPPPRAGEVVSDWVSLPEGYARSGSSRPKAPRANRLIWVTPTPAPWCGGAAPNGGRIVRPSTIAAVRTPFVRNAVTPMPIAPLVTPVVAVPAAAAAVTHQL
jgi:hypothetical protein